MKKRGDNNIMVEFHEYAWGCPECGRYKGVKSTKDGSDQRIGKCCGREFLITTHIVPVTTNELQIKNVEQIK